MLLESVIILVIIIFIILLTIRSYGNYWLFALPIAAIPLFYVVVKILFTFKKIDNPNIEILAVAIGAGFGSLASFVLSHFMFSRRGKILYTIFGIIMSCALMIAYLHNLL